MQPRCSGILLHPTSLPGPFGIGDLGRDAYRFVDFLNETGQSLWQVLPLGPTGYGNSPYMCFSAFGGNPLLINLEQLADQGLLDKEDIAGAPRFPAHRVDYGAVYTYKKPLLEKAFQRFTEECKQAFPEDFYRFCEQHAFWLDDFALFMALKDAHSGYTWHQWEAGAAQCHSDALVRWHNELASPIQYRKFLQFMFFKQWDALKHYCHLQNIKLIGDMPIYVAYDSAEVWANRHFFHLDDEGKPIAVAGVPPDYFSATGQRWGNPLYRWDAMAEDDYRWWVDRFRVNFSLVDIIRLDHFRGFEAYWEVPAAETTSAKGAWVKGPGAHFFHKVREVLSQHGIAFNVIAEDLGVITNEVDDLRDSLGLPGMRILQMAFGQDPKAQEYRPHNHIYHCVVYTATHDHNTSKGWFTIEPGKQTTQTEEEVHMERASALAYLGTTGEAIHWDMIRLALGSVAEKAIFPLQDVLGLDSESRMNLPGTSGENWGWRFSWDMLDRPTRKHLAHFTRVFERDPRVLTPDD
ncbi:MAG: 4-alpha-glucanotransferase [Gammaproteobacteria bacterium]